MTQRLGGYELTVREWERAGGRVGKGGEGERGKKVRGGCKGLLSVQATTSTAETDAQKHGKRRAWVPCSDAHRVSRPACSETKHKRQGHCPWLSVAMVTGYFFFVVFGHSF